MTHVEDHVEITSVRALADGRLDGDNAARYIGRKPKTLAMWRVAGKGPDMATSETQGLSTSHTRTKLTRQILEALQTQV